MRKSLPALFIFLMAACGNEQSMYSCESSAVGPDVGGTFTTAMTAANQRKATPVDMAAVLNKTSEDDGSILRAADSRPAKLPIWGDDLVRYEGNPVIVGTDVSPRHSFVADPYLLVVNDRLYMFFEAFVSESSSDRFNVGLGEIWMAESIDGFTWSNFQKVSSVSKHLSHPEALIYDGKVHVFYNHNRGGAIYYRSSPLDTFPDWSEETIFFTGSTHGWHHLVDFTVLEHRGVWYLLGITGNQPSWTFRRVLGRLARASGLWAQDQWIRGRWAGRFNANWDLDSREMTPYPLLDVDEYDWLDGIVEITSMQLGNRIWLSMGVCQASDDGTRSIGTLSITALSPDTFKGVWLNDGFTFPLAPSGWDDTDIHRSHAVPYKGKWIYVYDGRKSEEWMIGVATMPVQ